MPRLNWISWQISVLALNDHLHATSDTLPQRGFDLELELDPGPGGSEVDLDLSHLDDQNYCSHLTKLTLGHGERPSALIIHPSSNFSSPQPEGNIIEKSVLLQQASEKPQSLNSLAIWSIFRCNTCSHLTKLMLGHGERPIILHHSLESHPLFAVCNPRGIVLHKRMDKKCNRIA